MADTLSQIYFSDAFGVSPETLEAYGALDISLINDLPLFIDPFLLFYSSDPEHQSLHASIIRYLRFLRDKAAAGRVTPGLLEAWFTFREIKQNWLGYSLAGNAGRGLGHDFAIALHSNLQTLFRSFGQEDVTRSSHLEKLCLIDSGIGRDNISDLVTNLIKGYLLDYTQRFAVTHLRPAQRRRLVLPKASFNYELEVWEARPYDLPFHSGDYIILTPLALLTKDEVWINRADVYSDFHEVVPSIGNVQLRAQINNYFQTALGQIVERDERRKEDEQKSRGRQSTKRRRSERHSPDPTKKQENEAISRLLSELPAYLDWYIRWKEDHGDKAEELADSRVRASEQLYIAQIRQLVAALLTRTAFYQTSGTTHDEATQRVAFLKDVIENQGGWRMFYQDGKPIRREADLQIMFRLTWCNTPSDLNREVNNGRGPSDFEASRGRWDKSIIEVKLAKNSALARNLKHQAEIYKKASGAQHAIKVIVCFDAHEVAVARSLLKQLGLQSDLDTVIIDARKRVSASRASDETEH
jgi:hypothetical protein